MACPDSMTTFDITAVFNLNKNLSDSTDEILRLQGISWLMRKLIAASSITLYVKHYKDENGVEHIDINQVGTGGIGNFEERMLDWEERGRHDNIFGDVIGKTKRVGLDEIEHDWQKEDWLDQQNGFIRGYVVSDTSKGATPWQSDMIWGFAVVDGLKRYVRRIYFTGPKGETIQARMVFDYGGTNES